MRLVGVVTTEQGQVILPRAGRRSLTLSLDLGSEGCLSQREEPGRAFYAERRECAKAGGQAWGEHERYGVWS